MKLNAITAFKLILFFVLLLILSQLLWRLWDSEMNFRELGESCLSKGGEITEMGCDEGQLKYAFVAPEGKVLFCCVSG